MSNINDFGMPFTSQAGDRAYSSLDWRSYFSSLLEDGIIGGIGNELKVKPQSAPNKTVYVDTGAIFMSGAMRLLVDVTNLSVADNTSGEPRIDRIVARLNLTNRKIEFAVRQGSASESPNPPELIQNGITWELSLAQVYLANGFSTITIGVIADERGSEDLCGYFRYRAKPAWYPEGGTPPYDAWMYSHFKELLSVEEVADIEANATLMNMVLSSNKVINLFPMTIMNALQLHSAESETISANTTLADKVNIYEDLTIDSGVTLTCTPGTSVLIVLGNLTLNGNINASGKGGAGGSGGTYYGAGGTGGGVVYVFAKRIAGTGAIQANGEDGVDQLTEYSGTSTGNGNESGVSGSFIGNTTPVGSKAHKTSLLSFLNFDIGAIGGGGGKSGYYEGDDETGPIAAGGHGVYAAGANDGSLTTSGDYSGAGGGGGGGAIIIVSLDGVPEIAVEAKGGAGGSAETLQDGIGGSGGGGGLISIAALTNAATTSVSGGAGGMNGTYNGNSVNSDGDPGLVEFYELQLIKGV
ncbi:hypothetical protein JR334_07540 [Clostridia bacterium]|nr:hypothetical protein JR334_07540 [Clostridia bacterium]